MTLAIDDTIRNAMMDAISAAIDAGATGGLIRFYNGAQPVKGGTVTTLLGTVTFAATSYNGAVAGAMTANAIVPGVGVGDADATWFRVVDSNLVFVMDGTVGVSGADINLNTITISTGIDIDVTSSVLTAGNA